MNKKEYRIPIRFRGEGETNKEAEARIKHVKLYAKEMNCSFAAAVRAMIDQSRSLTSGR